MSKMENLKNTLELIAEVSGEKKFFVQDTETTGLLENDQIYEFAGVLYDNGKITKVHHYIEINNGKSFDNLKKNNPSVYGHIISDKDYQALKSGKIKNYKGATYLSSKEAKEFLDEISKIPQIAYNAQFDIGKEKKIVGSKTKFKKIYDAMTMAVDAFPTILNLNEETGRKYGITGEMGRYKMEKIYTYLSNAPRKETGLSKDFPSGYGGVKLSQQKHTAISDVQDILIPLLGALSELLKKNKLDFSNYKNIQMGSKKDEEKYKHLNLTRVNVPYNNTNSYRIASRKAQDLMKKAEEEIVGLLKTNIDLKANRKNLEKVVWEAQSKVKGKKRKLNRNFNVSNIGIDTNLPNNYIVPGLSDKELKSFELNKKQIAIAEEKIAKSLIEVEKKYNSFIKNKSFTFEPDENFEEYIYEEFKDNRYVKSLLNDIVNRFKEAGIPQNQVSIEIKKEGINLNIKNKNYEDSAYKIAIPYITKIEDKYMEIRNATKRVMEEYFESLRDNLQKSVYPRNVEERYGTSIRHSGTRSAIKDSLKLIKNSGLLPKKMIPLIKEVEKFLAETEEYASLVRSYEIYEEKEENNPISNPKGYIENKIEEIKKNELKGKEFKDEKEKNDFIDKVEKTNDQIKFWVSELKKYDKIIKNNSNKVEKKRIEGLDKLPKYNPDKKKQQIYIKPFKSSEAFNKHGSGSTSAPSFNVLPVNLRLDTSIISEMGYDQIGNRVIKSQKRKHDLVFEDPEEAKLFGDLLTLTGSKVGSPLSKFFGNDNSKESWATSFGTAHHSVVESIIKKQLQGSRDSSGAIIISKEKLESFVLDKFNNGSIEDKYTFKNFFLKDRSTGKEKINERYTEVLNKTVNETLQLLHVLGVPENDMVASEKTLGAIMSVNGRKFTVGGTLDLAYIDKDGNLIIGDFKTGKEVYSDYVIQATIYAALYKAMGKKVSNKVKIIHTPADLQALGGIVNIKLLSDEELHGFLSGITLENGNYIPGAIELLENKNKDPSGLKDFREYWDSILDARVEKKFVSGFVHEKIEGKEVQVHRNFINGQTLGSWNRKLSQKCPQTTAERNLHVFYNAFLRDNNIKESDFPFEIYIGYLKQNGKMSEEEYNEHKKFLEKRYEYVRKWLNEISSEEERRHVVNLIHLLGEEGEFAYNRGDNDIFSDFRYVLNPDYINIPFYLTRNKTNNRKIEDYINLTFGSATKISSMYTIEDDTSLIIGGLSLTQWKNLLKSYEKDKAKQTIILQKFANLARTHLDNSLNATFDTGKFNAAPFVLAKRLYNNLNSRANSEGYGEDGKYFDMLMSVLQKDTVSLEKKELKIQGAGFGDYFDLGQGGTNAMLDMAFSRAVANFEAQDRIGFGADESRYGYRDQEIESNLADVDSFLNKADNQYQLDNLAQSNSMMVERVVRLLIWYNYITPIIENIVNQYNTKNPKAKHLTVEDYIDHFFNYVQREDYYSSREVWKIWTELKNKHMQGTILMELLERGGWAFSGEAKSIKSLLSEANNKNPGILLSPKILEKLGEKIYTKPDMWANNLDIELLLKAGYSMRDVTYAGEINLDKYHDYVAGSKNKISTLFSLIDYLNLLVSSVTDKGIRRNKFDDLISNIAFEINNNKFIESEEKQIIKKILESADAEANALQRREDRDPDVADDIKNALFSLIEQVHTLLGYSEHDIVLDFKFGTDYTAQLEKFNEGARERALRLSRNDIIVASDNTNAFYADYSTGGTEDMADQKMNFTLEEFTTAITKAIQTAMSPSEQQQKDHIDSNLTNTPFTKPEEEVTTDLAHSLQEEAKLYAQIKTLEKQEKLARLKESKKDLEYYKNKKTLLQDQLERQKETSVKILGSGKDDDLEKERETEMKAFLSTYKPYYDVLQDIDDFNKSKKGSGSGKESEDDSKFDIKEFESNTKEIMRLEQEAYDKSLSMKTTYDKRYRAALKEDLQEIDRLKAEAIEKNRKIYDKYSKNGAVTGELSGLERYYLGSYDENGELVSSGLMQKKLADTKAKHRGQETLWGQLGSYMGRSVMNFMNYSAIYKITGAVRKGISEIANAAKNLDSVMTNLRIVTGDSAEETRKLMLSYSDLGSQLSATTSEVSSAANEWLRQGYEANEVTELITASLYLSKLGMVDTATATKTLTSTLKGFKLEATDAVNIVDKLTKLDMSAAISASEIGQGLAQFAATGSLAGLTTDQAAALVTTIADVSQKSGSEVGNALRTIISRYGNVKAGAFSSMQTSSDSDEAMGNLNDVEKVLNKIGISLRTSNLEMRDFDDVLDDLAEKWNTLDTVSKRAVSTAFAGKQSLMLEHIVIYDYAV